MSRRGMHSGHGALLFAPSVLLLIVAGCSSDSREPGPAAESPSGWRTVYSSDDWWMNVYAPASNDRWIVGGTPDEGKIVHYDGTDFAVIDHGNIIAMASPRDLITESFKEKAIQFDMTPPPDEAILRALPGVTNLTIDAEDVVVYSDNISATMSALLRFADEAGLTDQLNNLHVRQATLEDVFLKLTGRKIGETGE